MGKEETTPRFEESLATHPADRYALRLYVTGATPSSGRAIANVKAICEEHLRDRYDLEVIDIYQQPDLADEDEIVAAPTLVKRQPLPLRRLVGDLSDPQRVLLRLNLETAA
ncbi:MAG TPA: circadian clock KaiB family protein [Thermoanaerobaculia bacterium]|jgi:circadian clock protein KaiB